ncbi:MAG: hypothetical protein HYX36_09815 [Rhizobiales bacterium]|nr:hypothetical protein [Hyphomicrobiales bacterium]
MMQDEETDEATVIDTDNTRSGVTGHHVRYVLAFGIAGLIVALAIVALVV